MIDFEYLELEKLLRAYEKHFPVPLNFLDPIFEKQNELILDNDPMQAWLCTRRGAKSTSFAKKSIKRLMDCPGQKCLYLALSLGSAKGIIWEMLEDEISKHKIPCKMHKNEGYIDFDNGSHYRLFGIDASYKEMKKILGQKYGIVGIDEAGSMTINMHELVYQMILPTLADQDGQLILLGTCENIPKTFYESVTEGKEKGWKVHKWTTFDNPYMKDQWEKLIKRILEDNPLAAMASWFKTHYLNQWCTDDNLKIINLTDKNNFKELPAGNYLYTLGVDLGFNDDSSFSIIANDPNVNKIYIVHTSKNKEMDFTDVANQIKLLQTKFQIYKTIVDGANKQGVEEIRNRHFISLEAAEKTDKHTFLRLMADDVKQGILMLKEGEADALAMEWDSLIWDKKDLTKEDARCNNHLSDATLYAWREARKIYKEPKQEEKEWNPEQEMLKMLKQESEELRETEEETNLFL